MGEDGDSASGYLVHLAALLGNIAMVVIGVKYDNVCTYGDSCDMERSCNIQIVPDFLKTTGGIMIGFEALFFSSCLFLPAMHCSITVFNHCSNQRICFFRAVYRTTTA